MRTTDHKPHSRCVSINKTSCAGEGSFSRLRSSYGNAHTASHLHRQEFCVPVVQGRPRLRSASTGCVDLPRVQTSVYQRSFTFHGPTVWNSLSSALRDSRLSLNTFQRRLKSEDPSVWTVMNPTRHRCGVSLPFWMMSWNKCNDLLAYLLKTWKRTAITRRCWSWRIQLAGRTTPPRPLQHPPNEMNNVTSKTRRVLLCRVGWIISSSRCCWLVMRLNRYFQSAVSMITFVAYLQQSYPYMLTVWVDIRSFALWTFSHVSWHTVSS